MDGFNRFDLNSMPKVRPGVDPSVMVNVENPDPKIVQEALARLQDDKDVKLSAKERERLTSCFKEPEFLKLFKEYADEVSDPKNREEHEQYIRQCEAQGMNDGAVQMVIPDPGFCVKTKMVRQEGEPETKLFVNICYSSKIIQGTCTKSAKGESWHIPYSISKPRPCKDQKGNDAELFDWVCSDETYRKAETHQRFKTLLTNCALDGVEKQYQAVKHVTPTIEKDVVFLKRAFYGEQKPEMQTIKEDDPENPQVVNIKDSRMNEEAKAKAAKEAAEYAEAEAREAERKRKEALKPVRVTPKHTVVHRGLFDLGAHTMDNVSQPGMSRPKELVVRIELPALTSAAACDLDVNAKKFVLKTPKAKGNYLLDIELPYLVDEEKSKAKFDKTAKMLTVTLPLLPPTEDDLALDPIRIRQMQEAEEEKKEAERKKAEKREANRPRSEMEKKMAQFIAEEKMKKGIEDTSPDTMAYSKALKEGSAPPTTEEAFPSMVDRKGGSAEEEKAVAVVETAAAVEDETAAAEEEDTEEDETEADGFSDSKAVHAPQVVASLPDGTLVPPFSFHQNDRSVTLTVRVPPPVRAVKPKPNKKAHGFHVNRDSVETSFGKYTAKVAFQVDTKGGRVFKYALDLNLFEGIVAKTSRCEVVGAPGSPGDEMASVFGGVGCFGSASAGATELRVVLTKAEEGLAWVSAEGPERTKKETAPKAAKKEAAEVKEAGAGEEAATKASSPPKKGKKAKASAEAAKDDESVGGSEAPEVSAKPILERDEKLVKVQKKKEAEKEEDRRLQTKIDWSTVEEEAAFVASHYWQGSRAGYVFMSGKKGQGYYFDTYKTDLQEREETLKAVLQDASKEKKKLKAADVTFANTLCFELD